MEKKETRSQPQDNEPGVDKSVILLPGQAPVTAACTGPKKAWSPSTALLVFLGFCEGKASPSTASLLGEESMSVIWKEVCGSRDGEGKGGDMKLEKQQPV